MADAALRILNILMNDKGYVSTQRLCEQAKCGRKTVYNSIAKLEINGFGIDEKKEWRKCREYKLNGIYGF